MKMFNTEISSDNLRAERTWLLQHGKEDFMANGMSNREAHHAVESQVEELSKRIDKMEGRV
jgi:hypothetical protein